MSHGREEEDDARFVRPDLLGLAARLDEDAEVRRRIEPGEGGGVQVEVIAKDQ